MTILLQTLRNDRSRYLTRRLLDAGFTNSEVASFLSPALGWIVECLRRCGSELVVQLETGDLSPLVRLVDVVSLAKEAGIPQTQARSGVDAILPEVISFLRERAGGTRGIPSLIASRASSPDRMGTGTA